MVYLYILWKCKDEVRRKNDNIWFIQAQDYLIISQVVWLHIFLFLEEQNDFEIKKSPKNLDLNNTGLSKNWHYVKYAPSADASTVFLTVVSNGFHCSCSQSRNSLAAQEKQQQEQRRPCFTMNEELCALVRFSC